MKTFAVFFAGGMNRRWNYGRYSADFKAILTSLSKFPGLSADTVTILSGEGVDAFQFEEATIYSELANRENLKSVLQTVALSAEAQDRFFFFASNHGGQDVPGQKSSNLICWGRERVAPADLASWSRDILCAFQVFILGQCYSGGFIDALKANKRAILTACTWNEVSWASSAMGAQYDEFLFLIAEGFEAHAPTLNALFAYAKKADREDETPQFNDSGKIGDNALWE